VTDRSDPNPRAAPISPAPSPSLLPRETRAGRAYELKFLVDESIAQRVHEWARVHLRRDPYSDPELDGAYRTTTLYFDTPSLDVYHRTPSYRRRKYRIRRYGLSPWVHLERKTKSSDRVSKRRSVIPDHEIAHLASPDSPESWPGNWFHRRLAAKDLGPACRMSYLRNAYVGSCPEGPLRMTLDRDIRGIPTRDWDLAPCDGVLPPIVPLPVQPLQILPTSVILELKFLYALPLPFKRLIHDLAIGPAPISKYRLCREAWAHSAASQQTKEARRA